MGFGLSLILIALGAILTWAVQADPSGVNVTAVGVIVMVVGVIGLVISLLFWTTWGGPGYFSRRRTAYVEAPGDVVERERIERY